MKPQNNNQMRVITTKQQVTIGPLPDAENYAGYENTLKGSADRILIMAEERHKHWMKQEQKELELEGKLQNKNLNLSLFFLIGFFVVIISAIIAGVILVVMGFNVSGLVSIFFAIAGMIGAMLRFTHKDPK